MQMYKYLAAMNGLSFGVGFKNGIIQADAVSTAIQLHRRYSPSLIDLEIKRFYVDNMKFLALSALVAACLGVFLLFASTAIWTTALGAVWVYMGVRALLTIFSERLTAQRKSTVSDR